METLEKLKMLTDKLTERDIRLKESEQKHKQLISEIRDIIESEQETIIELKTKKHPSRQEILIKCESILMNILNVLENR